MSDTIEKYIRDEASHAVINTDEKEYNLFIRERAKSLETNMMRQKMIELENRLVVLEDKLRSTGKLK